MNKENSSASPSEAQPNSTPEPSEKPSTRAPSAAKRSRRMKMPDALRAAGVDEFAIASTYKLLLDRQTADKTIQDAKLLLDTARDCAKILEPQHGSNSNDGNFQLIHHIPRPNRPAGQ
jgi:hypothetical protein